MSTHAHPHTPPSAQPVHPARRTEPSAWLCASREQPILHYVASTHTDIRVLFERVRRELQRQRSTARPYHSWRMHRSTSA